MNLLVLLELVVMLVSVLLELVEYVRFVFEILFQLIDFRLILVFAYVIFLLPNQEEWSLVALKQQQQKKETENCVFVTPKNMLEVNNENNRANM